MFKKLLVIIFLTTLTITTVMPEDALAKGRRGKPAATKKAGRVAKASKGGKKAAVARGGKAKGRYVAKGKRRGRRDAAPEVSRVATSRVAIPPERVREIQTALIREGYLDGEPSGQYDRATVDAMTKYQQSNNFRSTGYPTAESLQKLGLTRQRRVTPPNSTVENKTDQSSSVPPQNPNFN